jgi:3-hydroxyacyl-CoA dehydrogenase/enoyl-CoA hydratase/3-hydroxybutyryl-CoA epimerase
VLFRRIETCGKPWVAAINGTAVGGGFELTLACHHRVAADNEKTRLGLPEVKVGLFPGAGGTQRVARIMQPADALQFLLKGDLVSVNRAKAMKLIDEVVPAADLIKTAKEWIAKSGTAKGAVGHREFQAAGRPGAIEGRHDWCSRPPMQSTGARLTTTIPAARAIMQVVYEGLQLPIDQALRVESRWFAKILRSPEAAAMIRSLFVSMQEINKGRVVRPACR